MNVEIREKLEDYIMQIKPNVELNLLRNDTAFAQILEFDSISFVGFIIEIETLFNIQFSSVDVYNMKISLKQLIEFIEMEVK